MVAVSLLLASLVSVPFAAAFSLGPRDFSIPFVNPINGGGSWFDNAGSGGGEPLNVIIAGWSLADVFSEDGLVNYARAIGFSTECFGIHIGDPQTANLGDGNGWVDQLIELRQDYGDADLGTCLESLIGGNHFRVWRQNGPDANTGALFLAVSQEEDVTQGHTISEDGYNVGRDLLAAAAGGITSFNGITYNTTVSRLYNIMPAGSDGVNHGIAVDGTVVVLTVN